MFTVTFQSLTKSTHLAVGRPSGVLLEIVPRSPQALMCSGVPGCQALLITHMISLGRLCAKVCSQRTGKNLLPSAISWGSQ